MRKMLLNLLFGRFLDLKADPIEDEELSPRECKVCQMTLDALVAKLKKEYRELLLKGGYLK